MQYRFIGFECRALEIESLYKKNRQICTKHLISIIKVPFNQASQLCSASFAHTYTRHRITDIASYAKKCMHRQRCTN